MAMLVEVVMLFEVVEYAESVVFVELVVLLRWLCWFRQWQRWLCLLEWLYDVLRNS